MRLALPDPTTAHAAVQAVKTVALADGTFSDLERRFLGALQSHVFGTDLPVDELSPIEPAALAGAVPVAELRVTVNAELVHREPVTAGARRELPLAFDRDAFVLVEVEGAAEGLYATVLPGFAPLAFANPIFVDADGDGHWTPPGLPDAIPDRLASPLDTP